MEALIPAYALSITMVDQSASSVALYEMTFLIMKGGELMLQKILIPVIEGYMLVGVADYVGETERFSYLGTLMKTGVEKILKWGVGAVLGMSLIENMILPAVDFVKGNAWRKGLAAIPGAGPMITAVTGTLLGAGMLLKNCIGACGMVCLVLICAVPFIKVLILTLSFYISAAMLQPICDRRLIGLLHTAGEGGKLFLQIILSCGMIFFITLALAAVSTNYGAVGM